MPGNSHNPSAKLRAVIFDYGEVLCHRPTSAEMAQLAGFFGLSVEGLPALWERNRGPFDRGDLTPDVYWSMLARDAGVEIGPRQLAEICALDVAMWSNVDSGMVEWARRLGASGMKLGLLSNMHPAMVAHCREQFAWLGDFDFLTFSGEVRLIKPDSAIYEHTLRGLGVEAQETLFLDDREINVRAARALGIHALQVQSMPQLRSELRAMEFEILP
ncbi:MAG TPA: HAD family phosphatase [Terriglobales bacterium]|nr:HAD family phosphatase [Terriglobales bacterium]